MSTNSEWTPGNLAWNAIANRLEAERFPIERDATIRRRSKRLADGVASGITVNVSSGGFLVRTEKQFRPGELVEVSMNWPVRLNDRCAVKMVARARVVRCSDGIAALRTLKHEFRTAGVARPPA